MIKGAKMSMEGWAASTPLCPRKNHINKKIRVGANNTSKDNKLPYLYSITILELCVDKRLGTMMTEVNNRLHNNSKDA